MDYRSQTNSRNAYVKLTITSSKDTYILGEIVNINLRLENRGLERKRMFVTPDFRNAHTRFWVSRDGTNFAEYSNPQGGKMRSVAGPPWIEPNQIVEGAGTLLWNKKPVVHHLNSDAARSVQEGKILTDYAFPESGTYYIKASFGALYGTGRIESEPIEITIVEPEGQDLEAWNAIKDREEIAYFLQEGSFRGSYKSVGEMRSREFEEIANRYPDSIIAAQLRQKLREYRARVGIAQATVSN